MKIGIDLDNTIINYNDAFVTEAKNRGIVGSDFSGTKNDLRDHLRNAENEELWQRLQGYIYGQGINTASIFPNVTSFLQHARLNGIELYIISHKSLYGHFDETKTNLRTAALAFLENKGVLNYSETGLNSDRVYFETTREEKVSRITTLELDFFIDDLPEVLLDPSFPVDTKKILFAEKVFDSNEYSQLTICHTWSDMLAKIERVSSVC